MSAPRTTTRKTLRLKQGLAGLAGMLMLGAAAPELVAGETGRVERVHDGDTLYLTSGLKVRLAGMQAPKISLGRNGFVDWPLGYEAKAALNRLAGGKEVTLKYGGEKRDRYDRALAQLFLTSDETDRIEPLWIQEEMIRQGYARVYSWADTYQDSERLYRAEREARKAGRGIWGDPFYAVRKPDPNVLAQDVDSFQIVEGVVVSTADIRGTLFLNFGSDYKTDFTVTIERRDVKRFKKAGLDPLALEGARVRVRGWIEIYNGPAIYLDHPERLEILD